MIDSGLIDQWMQKYWPKPISCENQEDKAGNALSLSDTEGAFFMFCAGITGAVLCVITESLYRKAIRNRFKWFRNDRTHV